MKLTAGAILALAGVGALGVLYLNRRAVGEVVGEAAQLVNPTSSNNVAYRGVNSVGAVLTGSSDFSLGSWLYDKFNNDPDPTAPVPVRTLPTTGDFARMDRASGTYYGPPEPERYSPGEWDFGGSFGYGMP